jgi:hypothetical protein
MIKPRTILFVLFLGIAVSLLGSAPLHAKDNDLVYKLKPGAKGKLCIGCHATFQDKSRTK